MFLYNISSILSIPIMLIGINGGYFPAMWRVCFNFVEALRHLTGVSPNLLVERLLRNWTFVYSVVFTFNYYELFELTNRD